MASGRSVTMAVNGMVATPHHLASQAGLKVLREGGNAVDAAIAANAVLTVVMPDSCSIGGDAFFLIRDPRAGNLSGLNGSGRAATGMTTDTVRAAGHQEMPERGPLSITVPGAVAAWEHALEAYGTRELGTLLGDAISYASDGFPVTASLNAAIQRWSGLLEKNPAARRQFLPSGGAPPKGTILRQPELGATLRAIADGGASAYYTEGIGEQLIRSLADAGSPLTLEDLAAHRSTPVSPISTRFRGYDVYEMPPNTQGITALQLLNIADGWAPGGFPVNSADQIHHFAESKKLAFQDRDRYVGDPEFVDVPIDYLNSREHADELRSRIDPERAEAHLHDSVGGGGTIYLCVCDSDGLAVSLIQSIFRGFGSGIVADGTGVLMQNRGGSFTLDPDAANSLQPGKRPLHTLIPGMILSDGRPWSVFGAMGGHGQAQTHLQLVTKMIDFGMDPQAAIDSPRWVAGRDVADDPEHLLRIEPDAGEDVIRDLRDRGHEVRATEALSSAMGHAQVIRIDQENGVFIGGADPRANGSALGW